RVWSPCGRPAARPPAALRDRVRLRPDRHAARPRGIVARRHRVSKDDGRARVVRGRSFAGAGGGPHRASHRPEGRDGVTDGPVTERLNTEGADPLTLAGVNDGNLVELSRVTGARVTLRGDTLTISGSPELVTRPSGIAHRMIEAARQRRELTPDDVLRFGDLVDRHEDDYETPAGSQGGNGTRIALPGVRRVIQPKTPGQTEYLRMI